MPKRLIPGAIAAGTIMGGGALLTALLDGDGTTGGQLRFIVTGLFASGAGIVAAAGTFWINSRKEGREAIEQRERIERSRQDAMHAEEARLRAGVTAEVDRLRERVHEADKEVDDVRGKLRTIGRQYAELLESHSQALEEIEEHEKRHLALLRLTAQYASLLEAHGIAVPKA